MQLARQRLCALRPAAILSGMAQITPPPKAASTAVSGSSVRPERPRGVGLSTLALSGLLALGLLQGLILLWGGTLVGAWSGALSDVLGQPGANSGFSHPGWALLQICLGRGIAAVCLWHYWRGRNWARILVLLWSFVAVAQALSFLAGHNLDPALLMARPLSFFQTVLASVLLYWLNTPAVRAWYRKTSASAGELIADRLRGRLCTAVEFQGNLWRLRFEHDATLILRCPWRIVLDDNLAFVTSSEAGRAPADAPGYVATGAVSTSATPQDELPPEAVPAPVHSPNEARRLLENLRVTAVRVANHVANNVADHVSPPGSDLFLSFEMGIELQTWSAEASSGPLWSYSDPGLTVIAEEAGAKAQIADATTQFSE